MNIEESLRHIAATSSLKYIDVAAGDRSGFSLRMKYTAPEAAATTTTGFPSPAAKLPDRRYLIASITKPIVAMTAVQLAADGQLALTDTVRHHLAEFKRGPLRQITIRHLLTHTSGLPDMLPTNAELRAAAASNQDFVNATVEVTPDFAAGTNCQYSSMGFAVLGSIIQSITQSTCAEHLERSVLAPAGMHSTWLGLPAAAADELMPTVLPCDLPVWQNADSNWSWNSRYWRTLGAPWGGMISTAEDLGRLATCLLNEGRTATSAADSVWSRAVVRACLSNQTQHIAGLSAADRVQRAWGFGWRQNWLDHSATFSDFLSADAYGHWGATGTMMWIDPARSRWCVILTTQPYEESQTVIQRLSNVVAAARDFNAA
ncbi:MAG: beta-lactamase family protein [Planctomycetaceae bacterium]|nr:beta-lactamase family protein [Planctomycetaceae bacterium]